MTATVSPPGASTVDGVRRPLTLLASLGGAAAAGTTLVVCLAVGVVGWFLTDSGVHGVPRDGLRAGALVWLTAHGSGIQVRGVPVTAVPLGLTLLSAWVTWRFGLRLGESVAGHGPDADALADGERDLTVPVATGIFAASYVVPAVLTGVLAGTPTTQPGIGPVVAWTLVLSTLVGGAAIAVGSGRAALWLSLAPPVVRATGQGVAAILGCFVAVSALTFLVALALDLGAAANVLARLHTDTGAAVLFSVLLLTVVPNAVVFGGSYLLGPGFTVGTGTLVSPTMVAIGPLPMFPLLAALPDNGPTPGWTAGLVAVPVLCGFAGAVWTQRRLPTTAWDQGALRGLVAGAGAALVFALFAVVAGGAVGPGRMADVGPLAGQVLFHGIVSFGIGGLLGGIAATWWQRRTAGSTAADGD
jgi:hypothetical protein